ncbi:MAG: hypothetical protein ACLS6G_13185 [Christensenellales bacterium]
MKRARQILELFLHYEFGLFTFGGGWSIIADAGSMEQGIHHVEELLDLTSVGRSLPGTMIGNVACSTATTWRALWAAWPTCSA